MSAAIRRLFPSHFRRLPERRRTPCARIFPNSRLSVPPTTAPLPAAEIEGCPGRVLFPGIDSSAFEPHEALSFLGTPATLAERALIIGSPRKTSGAYDATTTPPAAPRCSSNFLVRINRELCAIRLSASCTARSITASASNRDHLIAKKRNRAYPRANFSFRPVRASTPRRAIKSLDRSPHWRAPGVVRHPGPTATGFFPFTRWRVRLRSGPSFASSVFAVSLSVGLAFSPTLRRIRPTERSGRGDSIVDNRLPPHPCVNDPHLSSRELEIRTAIRCPAVREELQRVFSWAVLLVACGTIHDPTPE